MNCGWCATFPEFDGSVECSQIRLLGCAFLLVTLLPAFLNVCRGNSRVPSGQNWSLSGTPVCRNISADTRLASSSALNQILSQSTGHVQHVFDRVWSPYIVDFVHVPGIGRTPSSVQQRDRAHSTLNERALMTEWR